MVDLPRHSSTAPEKFLAITVVNISHSISTPRWATRRANSLQNSSPTLRDIPTVSHPSRPFLSSTVSSPPQLIEKNFSNGSSIFRDLSSLSHKFHRRYKAFLKDCPSTGLDRAGFIQMYQTASSPHKPDRHEQSWDHPLFPLSRSPRYPETPHTMQTRHVSS